MYRCGWIGLVIGCAFLTGLAAPAGDKKTAAPLVILDANGKAVQLKGWRPTGGVRRLPTSNGKGPLYLEFRDEHSTTYVDGILTLVPIASLRRLDYDYKKKTVTAVLAGASGDLTLTGSIKFKGINRLTIEGDEDLRELGELGFASVKFQGGNPKGGITGVRFAQPEPLPAFKPTPGALMATVIGADKDKTRHALAEPSVLYQLAKGSARLLPQLYFKKTVKLDLAKLSALRHLEPEDKKQAATDFEVTLSRGEKLTLTLLTKVEVDGKAATLRGLFGRVAAGYALFPVHTIAEVRIAEPGKK